MLTHKHSSDHWFPLVGEIRRSLFVIQKKNFRLKYEHEELETKKESPNHESKLKLL